MNTFTISQLAQFSGIKAHTIRIWEQRYGALTPQRSEGNTRYYDNAQLRRLLNIVSLSAAGYKLADLSVMKDEELFQLVSQLLVIPGADPQEYLIAQLVAAGMDYNERWFDKILGHCITRYGIRDAYRLVLYPMLERIGILWNSDQIPPASEHFISNLLRQKLYTAIDSLPPAKSGAPKWLCFLPEDEFHEIGLLVANYVIRSQGQEVIYLGTNVPFDSLVAATSATGVENLLTFLVRNNTEEWNSEFLTRLATTLRGKKIFVAAKDRDKPGVSRKSAVHMLGSVEELEQILQQSV